MLDRNSLGASYLFEALNDQGMVRSSMGKSRPTTQFHIPVLGIIDTRSIGRMGDIQAEADIRHQSMSGHQGSIPTNFLLDRIETDQTERRLCLCGSYLLHDLRNNETPNPVIDGPADYSLPGQFHGLIRVNCRMSDPNAKTRYFIRRTCSHVDPQLVGSWSLFIGEIAPQVDRSISDDSGYFFLITKNT